jgi:hypothetical protein
MKRFSGAYMDDLVIDEDSEVSGSVMRNIIVMPGKCVHLIGICMGNILLRKGAEAKVSGVLMGEVIKQSHIKKNKKGFAKRTGKGFAYKFSEGDFKRTQQLLNELKDLISKSDEIDEDHKSRLLRKLEGLQSELHKKVSDFDRFWGFIVESAVYLGKSGKAVKPIIDRIQELADIVLRIIAKAEDLPSPPKFPLLGKGEDANEN